MPAPAPPAAFPRSPSSSRRTRIGRGRRPCASMPRRLWPANRTRSLPIGSSAIRRSARQARVREAEMMLNAGDLDGRHGGVAGALGRRGFRPSRREEFSRPPCRLVAPRGPCASGSTDCCGTARPRRRTGCCRLCPADYRLLAEARLALAAQAPNAEALGRAGSGAAALRSGARLRAAALAAQKGHDRCRGPNSARPAQRSRPARRHGGRNGRAIARRVLAGGNAELAYRLVEQHGLIEGNAFSDAQFLLGLYCAALHEAAGPGLRALLAHPDAGRDTLCQGACRVLGGARRRGAGEIRARGEVVRRWGRAHGTFYGQLAAHQLGPRCAAASVPEPVPRWRSCAQIRR